MSKNELNKESVVKTVGVVLLGVIVLALFYNVFFTPGPMYGTGMNMGWGYGGMHGGGGYMDGAAGLGFGLNLGSILGGILLILIKLLSILLVIGLVVGIWVVVKDYLVADGDNPFASLVKPFQKSKVACPKCGSNVDSTWDFCPDCGQALTKENKNGQVTPNPAK